MNAYEVSAHISHTVRQQERGGRAVGTGSLHAALGWRHTVYSQRVTGGTGGDVWPGNQISGDGG